VLDFVNKRFDVNRSRNVTPEYIYNPNVKQSKCKAAFATKQARKDKLKTGGRNGIK
jgi:hypothetical protein